MLGRRAPLFLATPVITSRGADRRGNCRLCRQFSSFADATPGDYFRQKLAAPAPPLSYYRWRRHKYSLCEHHRLLETAPSRRAMPARRKFGPRIVCAIGFGTHLPAARQRSWFLTAVDDEITAFSSTIALRFDDGAYFIELTLPRAAVIRP